MSEILIQVEHLNKSYGNIRAVVDLTFQVPKTHCYGVLGPNGAGKTTMMKTLYGKAQPDRRKETKISVMGFDPRTDELSIKFRSGLVPQEDSLDVELNVEQNLLIFSKFYRLDRGRRQKRIDELLEFMELKERRKAKVRELSGGMKRRLVIARALLNNPDLLFLDEPTTGLDPQVRQLIWDRVRRLQNSGVTVVLTTHYMEEAYHLADTICIMDKGRKVLEGPPRKLLKEEIEPHVLEILNKDHAGKVDKLLRNTEIVRREESDQRVIYYAANGRLLRRALEEVPPGGGIIRASDLEDLFLKATGRNLNELQ